MPFLRVQEESGFARSVEDTARWSARRARLPGVVDARASLAARRACAASARGRKCCSRDSSRSCLGLAGLVVARPARRRARSRNGAPLRHRSRVLAFWASFGPGAGLYRVLYYLPTFSFLRAPSRLGLSSCSAWRCSRRSRCARIFDALPPRRPRGSPRPSPSPPRSRSSRSSRSGGVDAPDLPSPATRCSRAARAAPVAEFPFYGERVAFPLHAQYMLFSTRTGCRWSTATATSSRPISAKPPPSSTASRRTTRSRCWRAGACATSRSTGTCCGARRTRSAARLDAVRRESAGSWRRIRRMTLYEVVRYP